MNIGGEESQGQTPNFIGCDDAYHVWGRPAGNVTIPPNHDVPAPGTVVECRYLYAFKESGSIYQPVFLGTRADIRAAECITAQLKYKAEVTQAAA